MGVRVCVRACVKQIRRRRRIRSLHVTEHGGAMEETAACRLQQPRWAGRRGNAQNKGFLSSAHLSSSLSLAHVAPPLQGPSWWKKLRKHCEVWFKLQVCELLRHHS